MFFLFTKLFCFKYVCETDSHIYSFLLCPIFSGGEVLRDGKWEASYEVELKMKIYI